MTTTTDPHWAQMLVPAEIDAAAWPAGFTFAAGHCGLKRKSPDLMLVRCATPQGGPVSAAAVFTTNRLQAPPVRLSRAHLAASGGRVRALIVNSANANCATGPHGVRATRVTAQAVGKQLGCAAEQVLVCSTGVIGSPLPVEKILAALPEWAARDDGGAAGAQAILTTDTRTKMAAVSFRDGGREYRIAGMAKGSGMIHPNMATMLAFCFTDAPLTPAAARKALAEAVGVSFHRITVDGDTSTNDTAALFASGTGKLSATGRRRFQAALNDVAQSLARQIVLDGEGATHFVTVEVVGAASAAEADRAARAIAHSPLVKTALAGADANWGRVLAAAGYSGAVFDPDRAEIWFSGLAVYRKGVALAFDEVEAKARLERPEVTVRINLHAGKAQAWIWTCDLTEGYIRINGSYRT
ncbi:MAG TPA: bifunctional glutamate N-acetyltransferase/amino-acid acetyltransferase ArgJ [Terriglobales bacterium]|nr:bifunctional glutamate N-acetyltransferase/amino-acid acetyltransferase ArgJ [Terriglobales bacterium]